VQPISQPTHIRRWMCAALAAALLIVTLAPHKAPAQAVAPGTTSGAWQPVSLPAGITVASVADIAVYPSNAARLFLATASGIYSSTDAGQTWAQSTITPTIGVVVAPNDEARLYAWGATTFFRSDNGGMHWIAVTRPSGGCGLSLAPTMRAGCTCALARTMAVRASIVAMTVGRPG
jgi:photosystem II stability/assembly factor-like uncharacterized protein